MADIYLLDLARLRSLDEINMTLLPAPGKSYTKATELCGQELDRYNYQLGYIAPQMSA